MPSLNSGIRHVVAPAHCRRLPDTAERRGSHQRPLQRPCGAQGAQAEGPRAHGGPELLPDEPRHYGGDNYGFADGHTVWLPRKKSPDGTWAKEPEAEVRWEVGEQ